MDPAVVTVATAFHWFDPKKALPEIARALRGGGRLSLTWGTRDESDGWPRRLGELLRSVQPASLIGDWATGSITSVERSELFQSLEYAEFPFAQRIDRRGLLGLVTSRSYVMALDSRARERLVADVGALFDETVACTGSGERQETTDLALAYRVQCWRAGAAGTARRRRG